MTMQGEAAGEHVVSRSATARSRIRGDTMIGLVAAAGAGDVATEVRSEEPDGTRWSVTTVPGSAR